MKTLLLFATSLFATFYCLANGSEKVCVVTNSGSSGQVCSATELGAVNPCSALAFIVNNLTPPSGYVSVGKFEWFVNGISVKTTTDPSDPDFDMDN